MMTQRERRDRAVALLCNFLSVYLFLGLMAGIAVAVVWVAAVLGVLEP